MLVKARAAAAIITAPVRSQTAINAHSEGRRSRSLEGIDTPVIVPMRSVLTGSITESQFTRYLLKYT
jgi:hypothetical protein